MSSKKCIFFRFSEYLNIRTHRYQIIQTPIFGNVQKLRTVDSSWITVDNFSSDQIKLGHIRYIHNSDVPLHDEFKVNNNKDLPLITTKFRKSLNTVRRLIWTL